MAQIYALENNTISNPEPEDHQDDRKRSFLNLEYEI